MSTPDFKCPICGRRHTILSREAASAILADCNFFLQPGERPATLDDFAHCSRCGAPSSGFVPAEGPDKSGELGMGVAVMPPAGTVLSAMYATLRAIDQHGKAVADSTPSPSPVVAVVNPANDAVFQPISSRKPFALTANPEKHDVNQ